MTIQFEYMEYKFRGKRKSNGEWVFGCFVSTSPDEAFILIGVTGHVKRDDYECYMVEVIPETVGMCTGWKDKNGNPIYQDDMLRGVMHEQDRDNNTIRIEQVIFDRGGFTVFSKPMQSGRGSGKGVLDCFMWFDKGNHGMRDTYWQIDEIEIVGNIHKVNPPADSPALNTMNNANLNDPGTQQAEELKAEGQDVQAFEQEAQEKAMESEEEGGTEG